MFDNLLKSVIGVVVLPVDIVKDAVTLGGTLTNEDSAIAKRADQIGKNIDEALNPKGDE